MSSFAGRGLRATAAVAGIAAAGVGLAAPAFAAPTTHERPAKDDTAPAPTRTTPNVLGELPKTTDAPDLPQLFTIQGTGVYTADHGLPELPTSRHLPVEALPKTNDAVNFDRKQESRHTQVNFRSSAPQERGSAMQQLDAASMFGRLPGQVLGSTQNNDVHY